MPDPVVYFFVLGVLARAFQSDLKLPGALYEALSIYLLLAIGLKGGMALAQHSLAGLAPQIALIIVLGAVLPLIAFPVLRHLGRFDHANAGAIAAHYGSVSVVTYAVAIAYIGDRNVAFEPYTAVFVALLEVPGIIVGVFLGRRTATAGAIGWTALLREILLGKSIVLLIGGLAIGWLASPADIAPVSALFVDLFKGVLCLFLLEMGLVVGGKLKELRHSGTFLIAFGLMIPLLFGVIGALCGLLMGLSTGGTALIATLAASASYIAAPAATRMALPSANPAISLTAALAVTFPFNITFGIPLYLALAEWLHT